MYIVKLYLRVLRLLGPEKRMVAVLLAASVVIALAQFAEPVLFGKIVDQLTRSTGNSGAALPANAIWSAIAPLAGLWIGFGLFNILGSALVALRADHIAETPLSEVVGRTRPVDISLFEDVAQIFFA